MTAEQKIRLIDVFAFIRRRIVIMCVTTIISITIAIIWVLTTEPVYRSEALIMPVDRSAGNSQISNIVGSLSGLGALGGGSFQLSGKREEFIAMLRSRVLTEKFIREHDLLPVLFYEKWNSATESWEVEDESKIPTIRVAHRMFDEEIRAVHEDRERGLVTVAIEWNDRAQAADWANWLVRDVNEMTRKRAIEEAESNIEFLRAELNKWSVVELKQSIYQLIEAQLSQIMLANSTKEFAFRVIDAAVVPDADQYVWPRKALMVVLGAFIGGIFGFLVSLGLEFRRELIVNK